MNQTTKPRFTTVECRLVRPEQNVRTVLLRLPLAATALLLAPAVLKAAPSYPTNGLIAAYLFEGDAADASGNGHLGAVHGATLTQGRFGNANSAYSFDGVDDYIDIPHSSQFTSANKISISQWVNVSTFPQNSMTTFTASKSDNDGANDPFRLQVETAGTVHFQVEHAWGDGIILNSPTGLLSGQWHHIVAIYDFSLASDNLKIYLDGVLDGSSDFGKTFSAFSHNLTIGAHPTSSGHALIFDGIIDDTLIYNRALSAPEIQLLFVPEPTSLTLLALGAPLIVRRRRQTS